jgi:hypothetical protein
MRGLTAFVLVAFVVAGCVDVTPGPSPSPIAHATGERDVLLRMAVGGGLPYPGLMFEDPATYTLYGNGHLIYAGDRSTAGAGERQLLHAQITDEQVDTLLAYALGPAGLANARERYADAPIFDASTTFFEVNAGGVDKNVAVYALGFSIPNVPDAAARAAFDRLADELSSAGSKVQTGEFTDLGPYDPEGYRVTLADPHSSPPSGMTWPWPDLTTADFAPDANGNLVRIVTPEQGRVVLDLGISHDLVVTGPDSVAYLIRIRPLLPDELT